MEKVDKKFAKLQEDINQKFESLIQLLSKKQEIVEEIGVDWIGLKYGFQIGLSNYEYDSRSVMQLACLFHLYTLIKWGETEKLISLAF